MKLWSSKLADKKFSEKVRSVGVCRRPNCPYCKNKKGEELENSRFVLQCSHFWGRNCSSTRYELDNADCFCSGTHFKWENEKAGVYREYMLNKLGEKRYKELEKLHNTSVSRRDSIIKLMKELE
ncbi:hypothetical protein M0R04_13160 [Candidatus Dojkabacteria bacterium]|jgi:hypothetical protein|nr:hypothetical protein [Candidatus Dojkabacteria bacterium]